MSVVGHQNVEKNQACFQVISLSISDSKFQRVGLPSRGFRIEKIAKIFLFMEIVFNEVLNRHLSFFLKPWEPLLWFF